eukprot:gene4004-5472_t
MSLLKAFAGGLAGSLVLTMSHQLLKKMYADAPRMDLLGEEALSKGMTKLGIEVPEEDKLRKIALAGDILANTLFFGAAAGILSASSKGTILGIAAGVGGVYLPKKLGLNSYHSNKTLQTKILTVGLYALGGYVAGKGGLFYGVRHSYLKSRFLYFQPISIGLKVSK